MDLITKLGIDGRLLLAQILNFVVLLTVLNYFLYQPILKLLREREAKVKKSLEDSRKIEEELLKVAKEREDKLTEAKIEATGIIKDAQHSGDTQKETIINTAKEEAQKIIDKARAQSDQILGNLQSEALTELTEIIISVTEKILGKKITKEEDKKLVKEAVEEIISK
ncbi:F0F1 ATP synthase subunit B [Patescibacteria group bacterium]|nr:F0F1 ATP synthase subunit B [Patescibacteria group bacterium]